VSNVTTFRHAHTGLEVQVASHTRTAKLMATNPNWMAVNHADNTQPAADNDQAAVIKAAPAKGKPAPVKKEASHAAASKPNGHRNATRSPFDDDGDAEG
jgi:hypothetical protein